MRSQHTGLLAPVRLTIHIAIWTTMLALCCGCLHRRKPAYAPPQPNQPHAILKIRTVYHRSDGPQLKQAVNIGDRALGLNPPGPIGQGSTTPLLIHPKRTWLAFALQFYEFRQHIRRDTTGQSHTTTTRRTLAACKAGAWVPGREGETYLIQVNYMAHDTCTISCKQQLEGPEGQAQFVPCR